jgi:hypothetical protein
MALKQVLVLIVFCLLALDTSGAAANSLAICQKMQNASGYLPAELRDDAVLPDQPYGEIVDRLNSTALAKDITPTDPVVEAFAAGLGFDPRYGLYFPNTGALLDIAYPDNPLEELIHCPAKTLATGNGSCINRALTVCSLAQAMRPIVKAKIIFASNERGEGHCSTELELNGQVYEDNPGRKSFTKSYMFDVGRGWIGYDPNWWML